MKSKDKRLHEIARNRRNFKSLQRCIKSSFPSKYPRFERNTRLFEAEYSEGLAKDLESEKIIDFAVPIRESYKLAAINHYQAGIYSVFISDPFTAFKCFKKSEKNYRALAELVKEEPIYGLMIQEANVCKDKAKCARHEAAYRRARTLRIFSPYNATARFLNKHIYSKK